MIIAVDAKGTVKERPAAIAQNHDASPASGRPTVLALALDKGRAAKDAVIRPTNGVCFGNLAIVTKNCQVQVICYQVVVWLERKADSLLAAVESKGEVEFGVGLDSVGGCIDYDIVDEGYVVDGVSLE